MSLIRSDNHKHAHPKPEAEHYRFFNSGTGEYRDYVNQAEVLATLTSSDRKNKTVRIAGTDYLIDQDGTTFIPKGGTGAIGQLKKVEWTASGGENSKAVGGIGEAIGTFMISPIPMFEHTGELPVPERKYKYDSTAEMIYFGTPLNELTDYIFVALTP